MADEPATAQRLGIRGYARWRSERYGPVSHAAVRKAIESRRIAQAVVDGKIDPVLADRLWEANTDPAQQRRTGPRAGASASSSNAPPVAQPGLFGATAEQDEAERRRRDEEDVAAVSYKRASTIREVFRARLTELEYRQQRGELVNAAAVRRAQFELARRVRDRVRDVEDRCAARLVALPNEAAVRKVLGQALRDALEELAGPASAAP
jgi:hypothetical protein